MVKLNVPNWVKKHWLENKNDNQLSSENVAEIVEGLKGLQSPEPLVSIVIPVWNEEKDVVQTLSSLSKIKTEYPTELIFVNNNSTDRTQDVLDQFGATSILEKQKGVPFARQAGMEKAKGKYILCGDGDTIYPAKWVNSIVEKLEKPDVAAVYSRYSFIPPPNKSRISLALYEILTDMLFKIRNRKRGHLNAMSASLGFKRQAAMDIGGFDRTIKRGSDGRLAFGLSQTGKIVGIFSYRARVWTSSRRLLEKGGLIKALFNRLKREGKRLKEYI